MLLALGLLLAGESLPSCNLLGMRDCIGLLLVLQSGSDRYLLTFVASMEHKGMQNIHKLTICVCFSRNFLKHILVFYLP